MDITPGQGYDLMQLFQEYGFFDSEGYIIPDKIRERLGMKPVTIRDILYGKKNPWQGTVFNKLVTYFNLDPVRFSAFMRWRDGVISNGYNNVSLVYNDDGGVDWVKSYHGEYLPKPYNS